MFDRLFPRLRAFGGDRRGVALLLFAVLLVPFMLLIGVAIDVGHILSAKVRLQAALDASALYIASNPAMTDAQAQAYANAYISANLLAQTDATLSSAVIVTRVNNTVTVTGTASVNTTFLQFSGYNTLKAGWSSTATTAQNYLEVALVLDNTGSMRDPAGSITKIQGLKNAATALTNTLFANDPTGQYVKIGIVPFTAAVNVGTGYRNAAWMDTKGRGALTRENLDIPAGKGLLWLYSEGELKNASWKGCVRQRNEPYDIQDVAPSINAPDTLFTPYFAPDEPDSRGSYNSYLTDGNFPEGTMPQTIQRDIAKYQNGAPHASTWSSDPSNIFCPDQKILRLTNDQQSILSEINAMTADGNTVIPSGLMWGWSLISPNGPFPNDAVPYSDTKTIKAIILVTDGDNDVSGGGNNFNHSVYNAYGYGSGPHLNLVSGTPEHNIDVKLLKLCSNIKAVQDQNGNSRIAVYTIALGTNISPNGQSLLQTCASSPSNYFANPAADQLVTTFQQIAVGLNALRLSH